MLKCHVLELEKIKVLSRLAQRLLMSWLTVAKYKRRQRGGMARARVQFQLDLTT